jgi:SAM-dependent methyltransferase
MRIEHLQYIVCPTCKHDLTFVEIHSQHGDRIESGELQCVNCKNCYPVIHFIPRFVPEENYASSFGFQWIKHARTQYDSTSGVNISQQRFFEETRWERNLYGQMLLEVGSGSGRFTEHAVATGAMVVSLDYSNAVDANYASNGQSENLLIVQGDIYHPPFANMTFDKIMCIGVLQHTPDVTKAFEALPPFLKPGGSLVIDVYARKGGFWGTLNHLRKTRYWIRPIVRRVSPERLYHWCECYINSMWGLARLLDRVPRIGNKINWFLLIPDYSEQYPLPDDILKEWAILDLFDILSPAYDQPQTIETVRKWFQSMNMINVEIQYGFNGIEGRGNKPH